MTYFTIGIAGGTGSGKTTAVRRLLSRLGAENVALLEQDAYYRDAGGLAFEARVARNYDHPDAIDVDLLVRHIRDLQAGKRVPRPCYDFSEHQRSAEVCWIEPRPWILVEGILILAIPAIRETLDLRLHVETDADIRLARRIRRDLSERGRTLEGVLAQWEETVRPMHLAFVEPSKRHAHLVIPEAGLDGPALDAVESHLRRAVEERPGEA